MSDLHATFLARLRAATIDELRALENRQAGTWAAQRALEEIASREAFKRNAFSALDRMKQRSLQPGGSNG